MAAQLNGTVTPPTLYTVEQLELIRRLRNSGISREDVANAFDTFDRLDRELGPVYNIPVTLALQAQALQLMALGVANAQNLVPNAPTLMPLQSNGNSQPVIPMTPTSLNNVLPNNLQPSSNKAVPATQPLVVIAAQQPTPILPAATAVATDLSMIQNNQTASKVVPTSGQENGIVNHASQNSNIHQKLMEQLTNSSTKNGSGSETDNCNEELVEFLKKGELVCCEEIKAFCVKHNVKQQQIAVLSGICQSYVSRYMKGDLFDMSERSRRAIQKWYLIYRKNPAAIAVAASAATLLMQSSATVGNQQPNKKLFSNPPTLDFAELASNAAANGDLNFPRRERFVFRPSHVEILEKYFQDNNYPSYETREEIAQTCNNISEAAAGRVLTDREKVTVSIISNWFANKRKELKKMARDEGLIDMGLNLTRHRGHPSRRYSDLALLQQCRTGMMHSGNVSMDAAVTSSSTERSPNSMSPQGGTGSDSDEHQRREEQKSCMAFGDVDEDDDISVTWSSVELAAVNQAILSLTGQPPIDIAAGLALSPEILGLRNQYKSADVSDGCISDLNKSATTPLSSIKTA